MFFKIFKRIKPEKSFQGKINNRNHAVLNFCKNLDFPLQNIRRALIALNNIKLHEIAGNETSVASVSNTVNGLRQAKVASILVAQKLGIDPKELFPQED